MEEAESGEEGGATVRKRLASLACSPAREERRALDPLTADDRTGDPRYGGGRSRCSAIANGTPGIDAVNVQRRRRSRTIQPAVARSGRSFRIKDRAIPPEAVLLEIDRDIGAHDIDRRDHQPRGTTCRLHPAYDIPQALWVSHLLLPGNDIPDIADRAPVKMQRPDTSQRKFLV